MWKTCKKAFLVAHKAAKRNQKANNARGVPFGSVNDATQLHVTTPATTQPRAATQMHQHRSPYDVLPVIEAYTEDIYAATTTNHYTLYALVASNARL